MALRESVPGRGNSRREGSEAAARASGLAGGWREGGQTAAVGGGSDGNGGRGRRCLEAGARLLPRGFERRSDVI